MYAGPKVREPIRPPLRPPPPGPRVPFQSCLGCLKALSPVYTPPHVHWLRGPKSLALTCARRPPDPARPVNHALVAQNPNQPALICARRLPEIILGIARPLVLPRKAPGHKLTRQQRRGSPRRTSSEGERRDPQGWTAPHPRGRRADGPCAQPENHRGGHRGPMS